MGMIKKILMHLLHSYLFWACDIHPWADSLAVKGLDREEIGIGEVLVRKEAEFFVEQHIQNPPKSTSGKIFYSTLKFVIKNVHRTIHT